MFDELIGNEQIKQIFRRLLNNGHVPQSLLFAGKDGIGKKKFAIEIAKSFVCRNLKDFQACDECSACQRASHFEFPKDDDKDGHRRVIFSDHSDIGAVIPYKNNILVDAIRSLEEAANYRPYEGRARIFIIDEAEKMNDSATNALLKTLEEPIETTYIFLITSKPSSMLSTIISRCQLVRFSPVDTKEIENLLIKENYPTEDARLLARISRGSVKDAQEINLEKYREQRNKMLDVLDSLNGGRNRSVLLKTAEELSDAKNKDAYEENLEILQTLIYDIWTLKNDTNAEIANFDISNKIKSFAETAEIRTISKWLEEIEILFENLRSNLNKKIAADALFMKMVN